MPTPVAAGPLEVLFKFVNDSAEPLVLRLVRDQADHGNTGSEAAVRLGPSDSISFVLRTGHPYRFVCEQCKKQTPMVVQDKDLARFVIQGIRNRRLTDMGVSTFAPLEIVDWKLLSHQHNAVQTCCK